MYATHSECIGKCNISLVKKNITGVLPASVPKYITLLILDRHYLSANKAKYPVNEVATYQ